MEPHQLVTLFDLLKDLTSSLATLAEEAREIRKEHSALPVSYTHLTLPTILRV